MRVPPLLSAFLAVACLAGAGVVASLGGGSAPADPGGVTLSPPSELATMAATPTASPAPVVTHTPIPVGVDRGEVIADLRALLADPEFDTQGQVSITVLDQEGRVVLQRDPGLALLPASAMKLVTAAALLIENGSEGRLKTRILVDGPVSARGTLDGNVYVVAGGDPSLATQEYRRFVFPARPASGTVEFARVLRDAGIQRINGDIIADPGAYADQRIATGWRDAYFADFDARYITGLTVDAGLDVTVNHPRDRWPDLEPEDLQDGGLVVLLAQDPLVHASEVFREELARQRISVLGDATVGSAPVGALEVGQLQSPTMRELLTFMVKESDNHFADTLLRQLGAAISGRSTWSSSAQAAGTLLRGAGIDLSGAVVADGSGLSRENLISSNALATVDQAMSSSAHGDTWADLQAVAGRDGTLRSRLANTIVEGRFRGKTGTLNDVRALVGAVEGWDGRRYHVAVIGNGGEVWRVNTLIDQILVRLTRSLWCDVNPAPSDVVVACAA